MAVRGTPPTDMMATVSSLRGVDQTLNKLPAPVPVVHDTTHNLAGPAGYRADRVPTATEKAEFSKMMTGQLPRVDVQVTEEDIKRLEEKAWLKVLQNFDEWVVTKYCRQIDGPAKKDWLKRHYPELFDRMDEAMRALNDAKVHYEKLKIDKIDNIRDMWFMYTFERDAPLWENHIHKMMQSILGIQETPLPEYYHSEEAFRRGLWNLRRIFNTYVAIAAVPGKRLGGSNYDLQQAAINNTEREARRTGVTHVNQVNQIFRERSVVHDPTSNFMMEKPGTTGDFVSLATVGKVPGGAGLTAAQRSLFDINPATQMLQSPVFKT